MFGILQCDKNAPGRPSFVELSESSNGETRRHTSLVSALMQYTFQTNVNTNSRLAINVNSERLVDDNTCWVISKCFSSNAVARATSVGDVRSPPQFVPTDASHIQNAVMKDQKPEQSHQIRQQRKHP